LSRTFLGGTDGSGTQWEDLDALESEPEADMRDQENATWQREYKSKQYKPAEYGLSI